MKKLKAIESGNGQFSGFENAWSNAFEASHDPNLKGRPTNWTLPIRDFMVYNGARFYCTNSGRHKLMPDRLQAQHLKTSILMSTPEG